MNSEQLTMNNVRAGFVSRACCQYATPTDNDIDNCSLIIANLYEAGYAMAATKFS